MRDLSASVELVAAENASGRFQRTLGLTLARNSPRIITAQTNPINAITRLDLNAPNDAQTTNDANKSTKLVISRRLIYRLNSTAAHALYLGNILHFLTINWFTRSAGGCLLPQRDKSTMMSTVRTRLINDKKM